MGVDGSVKVERGGEGRREEGRTGGGGDVSVIEEEEEEEEEEKSGVFPTPSGMEYEGVMCV